MIEYIVTTYQPLEFFYFRPILKTMVYYHYYPKKDTTSFQRHKILEA